MEPKERKLPEEDEGVEIPVHVEDRRFWARAARETEAGATEVEDGAPSSRYPSFVEELQANLRAAEERLDATLGAHRRMQAEFDEARARLDRDFEARVERAKAELFRKLLDLADHLNLALQAAEKARPPSGEEDPMAEGVRLIYAQLLGILRQEGVERIDVLGAPFDPEVAAAVGVLPVEDPEKHDRVVEEIRSGYRLGAMVLRPAQVMVGKRPAAAPGADPGSGGSSSPKPDLAPDE